MRNDFCGNLEMVNHVGKGELTAGIVKITDLSRQLFVYGC